MAATPAPLVWDFYRQQTDAVNLVGIVHYYDAESQSLYLNSGLKTKTATIENGHWKNATQSSNTSVDSTTWSKIRIDHASNGTLYGLATGDGKVTLLRYTYGLDISSYVTSWSLSDKSDSPITQFDGEMMNIDAGIFGADSSLFQPGQRIVLKIKMGDSVPYQLAKMWLDEVTYDITSESVSFSARNAVGYFLKDQTFDDEFSFACSTQEMIESILSYSGITDYLVNMVGTSTSTGIVGKTTANSLNVRNGPGLSYSVLRQITKGTSVTITETSKADDMTWGHITDGWISMTYFQQEGGPEEWEFSPSDSLMDGIESVLDNYATASNTYIIREDAQGKVYIGRNDWMKTYFPKSEYQFNEGSDVFSRSTTKSADGSYTAIRVTGKDADGNELTPYTVEIPSYKYWKIGPHKTLHETAPDGKTQQELHDWALARAKEYQYVGIGESFASPFRPQLLIGDIAEILTDDQNGTVLGIINEVKHSFSLDNGYKTEFAVDSGGDSVETAGTRDIYTRSAKINGYNRRQNIMDIVKMEVGKKVSDGSKSKGVSGSIAISASEVNSIWTST